MPPPDCPDVRNPSLSSVRVPDLAAAPELGEARRVRLAPESDAASLLGLVIEIGVDAVGLDPPAPGPADLCATQPAVEDERYDLIYGQLEHLRDLRGREEANPRFGCFGHEVIIFPRRASTIRPRRPVDKPPCG